MEEGLGVTGGGGQTKAERSGTQLSRRQVMGRLVAASGGLLASGVMSGSARAGTAASDETTSSEVALPADHALGVVTSAEQGIVTVRVTRADQSGRVRVGDEATFTYETSQIRPMLGAPVVVRWMSEGGAVAFPLFTLVAGTVRDTGGSTVVVDNATYRIEPFSRIYARREADQPTTADLAQVRGKRVSVVYWTDGSGGQPVAFQVWAM